MKKKLVLIWCLFVCLFLFSNSGKTFRSFSEVLFKSVNGLDPYPSLIENKENKFKSDEMLKTIDEYNLLLLEKKISYLENINSKKYLEEILAEYKKEVEKSILSHNLEIEKQRNRLQKEKNKEKKLKEKGYSLDLEKRKQNKKLKKFIFYKKSNYSYSPYNEKTGVLTISDRKVELTRYLTEGGAKKIIDQINFYSSLNDYPIFLVMDTMTLGGSWFDTAAIIQAVESSRVPVYVVGGSVVAGSAAILLARAKYSFAYPETSIIFAEMSGLLIGTINGYSSSIQYSKFLKMLGERVYNPIIKKMNIESIQNLEQLYARFRKENINGFWLEYARTAKKYNWVSNVVKHIKDKSVDRRVDTLFPLKDMFILSSETRDVMKKLPPIQNSYNFYFIYQPKKFNQ